MNRSLRNYRHSDPEKNSNMNKVWTPEDYTTLKDLCDKYGSDWKKIYKQLNKSISGAKKRHASSPKEKDKISLKIRLKPIKKEYSPPNRPKVWTAEEDAKLVDLCAKFGRDWEKISEGLSERTGGAIKRRVSLLVKEDKLHFEPVEREINRISANAWTAEEDANLIDLYTKFGRDCKQISKNFIGRTCGAVKRRISTLRKEGKIHFEPKDHPSNAWTAEEDSLLINSLPTYGQNWEKLSKLLNSRTPGAVKMRAKFLHREKKVSLPPVVKEKDHPNNSWTAEEDSLLIDSLPTYGRDWEKLSKLLNTRTPGAVKFRAMFLQKEKKVSLPPMEVTVRCHSNAWTEEEDAILKNSFSKFTDNWEKIATFLNGRTLGAVKRRASALQLKQKK